MVLIIQLENMIKIAKIKSLERSNLNIYITNGYTIYYHIITFKNLRT